MTIAPTMRPPGRPGIASRPRRAAGALALALALSCPAAVAAPPARAAGLASSEGGAGRGAARPRETPDMDREAARALAQEGYAHYERGDYEGAVELFREAEERFHAPTHWLYIARASSGLRRLLEAERAYERVLAEALAPGAPRPFVDAQASAREEIGPLRARVPRVTVRITGVPAGVEPVISVDGAPAAPAEGAASGPSDGPGARVRVVRVDPGQRVIRVEVPGAAPIERRVALAEREDRDVAVAFAIAPPERGSIAPGLIALGLGAAGIGAGAVTGALSLGKVSDLEEACPDKRCTPAEQSIGDDARALGTASTVAFIAGGALTAAGVALLVIRPRLGSSSGGSGPRVEAWVGPGALRVRGSF